jgi:hypothetical protein
MCPVVRSQSRQDASVQEKSPVFSEMPVPAVAPQIRSLLKDLAAEDLRMAMLDLIQLSRALSGLGGNGLKGEDAFGAQTLICTEDGQGLVGICDGPDDGGYCPWANAEGKLPCNGSWLMTSGWMFKVAGDAAICPVAALGLTSRRAA